MAVLECRLKSQRLAAALDNDNRLTLVYQVKTDGWGSMWDIMLQCQTATPHAIPKRYTYIGDGMYVLSVTTSPREVDSRTSYVAEVECGPLPAGKDLQSLVDDPEGYLASPLERQLVVTVEADEYSRPLENRDLATGKLRTAANEPFDVPPEGQFVRSILTVRRNVQYWSDVDAINTKYQNTRNSDAVTILGRPAAVNSLRFLGAAGEPTTENNTQFYRATLRFQRIVEADYKLQLLNRGYKVRPAAGQPAKWAEDEGQRVPEPVLLKADGTLLPEGDDPTYITVEQWKTKAYAALFAPGILTEASLP